MFFVVIFGCSVFFYKATNSSSLSLNLLASSYSIHNSFTLAPVSLYAQKTMKKDSDDLKLDFANTSLIKLLSLALEKMNAKDTALYKKLNASPEEKALVLDAVLDMKDPGFWEKVNDMGVSERIQIVKMCSENDFMATLVSVPKFNFDLKDGQGLEAVIELAKFFVSKDANKVLGYLDIFGFNPKNSLHKKALIEIAKISAQNNGRVTAENFKKFGLDINDNNDRSAIIEIAKLCIKQTVKGALHYFEEFGLDGNRDSDKALVIELAEIASSENGSYAVEYFSKFHLNASNDNDTDAVVKIVKNCIKNSGNVVRHFNVFGFNPKNLLHKKDIIEIAKLSAEYRASDTVEYFNEFGLDSNNEEEKAAIVEVARICMQQAVTTTLRYFENFKLDGSRNSDKASVVELAEIAASFQGSTTAKYFEAFKLDMKSEADREAVLRIAKLCAQNDIHTVPNFKNFGLDAANEDDKKNIIELAKICALKNGELTAKYFENFGLDATNERDKQSIIDIAKICILQNRDISSGDFNNFGLNLTEDTISMAVFRYLQETKDIPWDAKKVVALEKFLEDGVLDHNSINLNKVYNLLRDNNLLEADEIYLNTSDIKTDKVDTAENNLNLMTMEDMLIRHNNNAIKFLSSKVLDKANALAAIYETEKMLDIYFGMFDNSIKEVTVKLDQIKEVISKSPEGELSVANSRLLRAITGSMNTLQDIIIYLHKDSIDKLFSMFTQRDTYSGTLINIKAGRTKKDVIDVLNLNKKEAYYSGINFLQDFYGRMYTPLSNLQTIVAGKKIYHYVRLGEHVAKFAMDLHSPETGGNILFEYNENQYDRLNKAMPDDVCGNDIRQMIIEEILRRCNMQIDSNGLNTKAVFNKETGAVKVSDLTDLYARIFYLLHVLQVKSFYFENQQFYFDDATLGKEYRERKNPSLFPDNQLIKKMINEKVSLINKVIDFHVEQKQEEDFQIMTSKGFSIDDMTVLQALEKNYQNSKLKKTEESYLREIFASETIFKESLHIANGLSKFKDLLVWDTANYIGKYKLVKSEIEIGYKDKDTLYALQDTATGEFVMGWMQRGVTGETVYDYNEFERRVKKEGFYPMRREVLLQLDEDKIRQDILNGFGQTIINTDQLRKSKGLSVSSGMAEGEVVIYKRGMHTSEDLTDKIVVVKDLTPEDDAYLLEAKGLIILKGGALSHGAIFAREIGVPAIILNSFRISHGKLKGSWSSAEPLKDENIIIDGNDIKISSLKMVQKEWHILEGDFIAVDGERGELVDIPAEKHEILRLLDQGGDNIENIISIAKKNKLGKWLYDTAYKRNHHEIVSFLENNNPAFKKYGATLVKKETEQKYRNIENLIEAISNNDIGWRLYHLLSKAENLLNTMDQTQVQDYEKKIISILAKKDMLVSQQKEVNPKDEKDFYDLSEIDESLMSVLGNKASKLGYDTFGIVTKQGGEIPEGIALNGRLSEFFYHIPYKGLPVKERIKKILKSSKSLEVKSKKIRDILDSNEIKRSNYYYDLENCIKSIYSAKWWGVDHKIAVRSSAIRKGKQLEDTVGTAGLYKSFMFVSPLDFFDSVVDVWKSLYSFEALSYYFNVLGETDVDALVEELAMGVVVQEMVDSDVSAVAFSNNPNNGDDEIIITAGYGQGEGVVSGIVPVDTIIVDRLTGEILEKNIVPKDEMLVRVAGEKELKKVSLQDSIGQESNILFVCTDNSCRSVMSEYLLRDLLKDKENVNISSGGFYAGLEQSARQETITVLAENGIDASNHKPKTISEKDLLEADIVIAMTDYQKDDLVSRFKDFEEKIVVLPSFSENNDFDDLVNPYGPDLEIYRELFSELKDIFKTGDKIYNAVSELKMKEISEKINSSALSKKEISIIVEIVKSLADEYDNPQDIELAVKSGNINVVQRRTITTLGVEEGENYYNRLRRLGLKEKIQDAINKIRQNDSDISYVNFVAEIGKSLNKSDEFLLNQDVLVFIENQWRNFKLMPSKNMLMTGKSSKLIKQAA